MKKFSIYFNQYRPLSEVSSHALDALAKPVTYPKGYLLHRQGQVSRSIYLILKGMARTYYYSHEGHNVTNQFYVEKEVVAAMESLYTQQPSYYNIELLEDCQLLSLDYQAIEKLYTQHHDLESCGRVLAIQCYLEENERSRGFQMMNAKQRYLQLAKAQPEILRRANLGHIASYIGISQVQLSRIRAEIV